MEKNLFSFLSLKRYVKVSLPYVLCLLFFIAYGVLSIVRHTHYQSFGYDLGINDQLVWKYSTFQSPITTISPFPTRTKLVEHIELIYAFISPLYWIWSARKMLLLIEAAFVCVSGVAVYLLAKEKKCTELISNTLVFSFLAFYGIQNAMWFDVHSASFSAAFLMWFILFLEKKKRIHSAIFFFLAITSKENVALLTLLISFIYFLRTKSKEMLMYMGISIVYLLFVFFIYFPYIVQTPYLYQNQAGLLSNLNPASFYDTGDKRAVIWYSLLSFGGLPLLSPLYLLAVIGDLATYFVIASDLPGAQGLFMQYRITLAPLLIWGTIMTISRFKKLNRWYIALYLILCTCFVQYTLHLPLSYLSKSWFWTEPASVKDINTLIRYLPATASVVSQNNITPHISHRIYIYTLYPQTKTFMTNSSCGKSTCDWFRWDGDPEFLIADTATDWDARHLLVNRQNFINGLNNLEKEGVIQKYKQVNSAVLYKVIKNGE